MVEKATCSASMLACVPPAQREQVEISPVEHFKAQKNAVSAMMTSRFGPLVWRALWFRCRLTVRVLVLLLVLRACHLGGGGWAAVRVGERFAGDLQLLLLAGGLSQGPGRRPAPSCGTQNRFSAEASGFFRPLLACFPSCTQDCVQMARLAPEFLTPVWSGGCGS